MKALNSQNFILKILLFIIFFIFGLIFLYNIGKLQYSRNYPLIKKIKELKLHSDKIDALVLGSSHAGCIRPEQMFFSKSYNLQSGGSDNFEVSLLGRSLLPHLPNLKCIFISSSYFSFSYDNTSYIDQRGNKSRADKRRQLYAAIPSFEFIEGDLGYFISGKLYPIITQDHWEKVLSKRKIAFANKTKPKRAAKKTLKKKKKLQKKIMRILHKKNINISPNDPTFETSVLNEHGIIKVQRRLEIIENMKSNHRDLETKSFYALLELVEKAKERNVMIIFVTTPLWRTYSANFDPYYKNLLKKNMDELVKHHNVEYYDFSDHELFQNPTYFTNADHIDRGAYPVFNKLLLQKLSSDIVKDQPVFNRVDGG